MCDITSKMLFVTYRSLTCTHVQPMDVVQNNSLDPILPVDSQIRGTPLSVISIFLGLTGSIHIIFWQILRIQFL